MQEAHYTRLGEPSESSSCQIQYISDRINEWKLRKIENVFIVYISNASKNIRVVCQHQHDVCQHHAHQSYLSREMKKTCGVKEALGKGRVNLYTRKKRATDSGQLAF